MKIIKQGIPMAPGEKPWWIGKDGACAGCGAVMRVEKGDDVVKTRPEEGIIAAVGFQCLNCGSSIIIRRPTVAPVARDDASSKSQTA
jgi:predicted RNA-binding Zn-ribbon protein involved in translation (DUF1610 family)